MNGVCGIANQGKSRLDITFGMTLAQSNAVAWVSMFDIPQTLFAGLPKCDAKVVIVERHDLLCLLCRNGPNNRAPVFAIVMLQGQQGERTVIGETLPSSVLMRLFTAHTGDNCMVQIIPLASGAAGQSAHCRVSAIGSNQKRTA